MIDLRKLTRSMGSGVELYDYKFEVPIRFEYKLTFTILTRGRFKKVFESVKKTWQEKHGLPVGGVALDTERLEVPEKVFKLLRVMIKPMYLDRKKALLKREKLPVVLLDFKVSSAEFVRVGDDWNIVVVLRGAFDDKK